MTGDLNQDTLVEITTTLGTSDEAESMAHEIVHAYLAACVQIVGPLRSVYRWDGIVQEDTEWRLVIKTRSSLVDPLMLHIKSKHPYMQPEILVLPILKAEVGYETWLRQVTERPAQGGDGDVTQR